ncbi:MarR family winged helix-turn-helix transcriptional regulator [Antribacter gilvus]|uniref:MarR family winged helix-turn-helix transcriptional regulator n=1 Tax=Antribacter gilvus TaxID=2304675 RepID=UPI000F772E53|nr:MarR family transcriptional regulator [Antribacter gilvus]
MEPGANLPVAAVLWHTVQRVTRAFDRALAEHGGSRPVWFILGALHSGTTATQRELAAAVGIREATLTHHLRALEDRGIITRHRDPANRRVQLIVVTPEGQALFQVLRATALEFEQDLRRAVGEEELAALRSTLAKLSDAVPSDGTPVTVPFD